MSDELIGPSRTIDVPDPESFDWSPWGDLLKVADDAPRLPGVYMVRLADTGVPVYVGRAGHRNGQGLRGRLRGYSRGISIDNGLGIHAADRALARPEFVATVLEAAHSGSPLSVRQLSVAALAFMDLEVRWFASETPGQEVMQEWLLIRALQVATLWNRR